jgi:predicted metalloprotease with PDZ domain
MGDLDIVDGTQRTSTARMANGPLELTSAQISNYVSIGPVTLKAPRVSSNKVLKFANVGHVLLAEAAVTIDLKNSRMRILPNGEKPRALAQRKQAGAQVSDRSGRRPLGIQGYPSAKSVTVSVVTPGSLAERAGIRAGDRVVEVGRDSNVGDALQTAFSASEAFSIIVERDGARVKLTVPAEETRG